jgi:hypothetical protein
MSFASILRLLTRVALVFGVVLFRRRARGRVPVPPSYRTPGTGAGSSGSAGSRSGSAGAAGADAVADWLRALGIGGGVGRRMPDVVEGVRLAGIAFALAAFGAAAMVLLSAGTTLTVLGPRWVGIVLLVLAVLFGLAAVREGVWLRQGVMLRRRRRWAARLANGTDEPD